MTLAYFSALLAIGCVICTLVFLRLNLFSVSTLFTCFGVFFTILSACQWRASILLSTIGGDWLKIEDNRNIALIYIAFIFVQLILLLFNINKLRKIEFKPIP